MLQPSSSLPDAKVPSWTKTATTDANEARITSNTSLGCFFARLCRLRHHYNHLSITYRPSPRRREEHTLETRSLAARFQVTAHAMTDKSIDPDWDSNPAPIVDCDSTLFGHADCFTSIAAGKLLPLPFPRLASRIPFRDGAVCPHLAGKVT